MYVHGTTRLNYCIACGQLRSLKQSTISIHVTCSSQASTKHVNESIAKKIHEKAAPIVEWLRNAEEESEEDEDDDVEVVYSEKVGAKGITTITETPPQRAEEVRTHR